MSLIGNIIDGRESRSRGGKRRTPMGERMCRSSHLLLPSSIPSLSWSREGMKRIVKRRKEFNGIREACRGQGSMPEICSTAIVPRFRGNKTISASVSLPFLSASPFQLIEQLGKDDRGTSSGTRERNHEFLPASIFLLFRAFQNFLFHLCV